MLAAFHTTRCHELSRRWTLLCGWKHEMKKEEGDSKGRSRGHARKTTGRDEIDNDEEEIIPLDARDIDQKEKQEFVERLRKKDEAATKNIAVPGLSKAEEEEIRRRREASLREGEERKETVAKLREFSRDEYLKLREPKMFQEFVESLADEKKLFGDQELTEVEKSINKLNQTLYQATKEARQMDASAYEGTFLILFISFQWVYCFFVYYSFFSITLLTFLGYLLPEGEFDSDGRLDKKKKFEKLSARYKRREEDNAALLSMFPGQIEWEENQVEKATKTHVGAKKQVEVNKETGLIEEKLTEDYDLILDSIDFLREGGDMLEGMLVTFFSVLNYFSIDSSK